MTTSKFQKIFTATAKRKNKHPNRNSQAIIRTLFIEKFINQSDER